MLALLGSCFGAVSRHVVRMILLAGLAGIACTLVASNTCAAPSKKDGDPVCTHCMGKKKYACYFCEGDGKAEISCPKCDGMRYRECLTCSSSGYYISTLGRKKGCLKCRGARLTICANCEAKGKVEGKCPACRGKKRLACSICSGTGIGLMPEGPDCPECRGEGKLACPVCFKSSRTATPCVRCTAHGYRPCETCGMSDMRFCKRCKGSGRDWRGQCAFCSGRRFVPRCPDSLGGVRGCPDCDGLGYVFGDCELCWHGRVPCRACFGSGKRPPPPAWGVCPSCAGTARAPCGACSGYGYLADGCTSCESTGVVKCDACGGNGEKICKFCKGAGKRMGLKCPVCEGYGKIPCCRCTGTKRTLCPTCYGRTHKGPWTPEKVAQLSKCFPYVLPIRESNLRGIARQEIDNNVLAYREREDREEQLKLYSPQIPSETHALLQCPDCKGKGGSSCDDCRKTGKDPRAERIDEIIARSPGKVRDAFRRTYLFFLERDLRKIQKGLSEARFKECFDRDYKGALVPAFGKFIKSTAAKDAGMFEVTVKNPLFSEPDGRRVFYFPASVRGLDVKEQYSSIIFFARVETYYVVPGPESGGKTLQLRYTCFLKPPAE